MYVAQIYINHGRIILDCPVPCGNAYFYEEGATHRTCDATIDGCQTVFELDVHEDIYEIFEDLERRPVKGTRNWFPLNHPLAIRGRLKHGMSLAEVVQETDEILGII